MRVRVDADLCQGYGVCAQLAPGVFELDDDGYASVPDGVDPAPYEAAVREAGRSCPVLAVIIDEE